MRSLGGIHLNADLLGGSKIAALECLMCWWKGMEMPAKAISSMMACREFSVLHGNPGGSTSKSSMA